MLMRFVSLVVEIGLFLTCVIDERMYCCSYFKGEQGPFAQVSVPIFN